MSRTSKQLGKLREFSTELAERLRTAPGREAEPLRLALRVGANHYLVDMANAGEIVALPETTRVPWTQPWYRGLVNVRGRLVGVVDLLQLAAGAATPPDPTLQLLVLNESLNAHVGLLVSRAFGLRNLAQLEPLGPAANAPPWEAQRYRDADGTVLTELNLGRLLASEAFASIGL